MLAIKTGNLGLLFSLQIFLQVFCLEYEFVISGCCRVEKVDPCCSCIHCPIGFGNSKRHQWPGRKCQMRLRAIGEVKPLQQEKDEGTGLEQERRAVQSRVE